MLIILCFLWNQTCRLSTVIKEGFKKMKVLILLFAAVTVSCGGILTQTSGLSEYEKERYLSQSDPIAAHTVVLFYDIGNGEKGIQCSGVLVAPNAVLTAGHCSGYGHPGNGMQLKLAHTTNLNNLTEVFDVDRIVLPKSVERNTFVIDKLYDSFIEKYRRVANAVKTEKIVKLRDFAANLDLNNSTGSDLALLFFKGKISANPITIADPSDSLGGKTAFAAGYGDRGRSPEEYDELKGRGAQMHGALREFRGTAVEFPKRTLSLGIQFQQNEPQSHDSGGPVFTLEAGTKPKLVSLNSSGPIQTDSEMFRIKLKHNLFGGFGPDIRIWKKWIQCNTKQNPAPLNCKEVEGSIELIFNPRLRNYI